jgi:TrmH family RNA methyltransferase
VLVASRNPLNIGAAARAMSNFGFSHLRVVNPYEIAFREARSAVGAATVMESAQEYRSVAEAVADSSLVVGTTALRDRQPQHPVRLLRDGASVIRGELSSSRIALLFGSEKRGLSNHDLSHCDWLLRIPTHERNVSMNLGQAVAVCLYELAAAQGQRSATVQMSSPKAGDIELLAAGLLRILRTSGYAEAREGSRAEERIRRLMHRMQLSAEDAQVWLGMVRQIEWKLRNP